MRIDQAVILVGGKGSRLGDLTQNLAKPMLDVGGRPFVEYVIAHLARFGVRNIILLAGHHGALPHDRYHTRQLFGADISVLVESEPLGTGGALRFAADKLDEQFILTNGDTYFDADLLPLLKRASEPQWSATMLLREIDNAARYGSVALDAGGVVRSFREKSVEATQGNGLINAGVYVMRRDRILPAIGKPPCSLEDFLFPRLAAEGVLSGVVAEGYMIDIGIPESLNAARAEIPARRIRPAAFFDRDGVLNIDKGYTHRPDDLVLMDGAAEAVRLLNEAGFYVFVVSNQAGVARGYYTGKAVEQFHIRMQEALMGEGAHIDAFYYCPHHPEGQIKDLSIACDCRKPKPGMLEAAAREWPIDLERSFLIGDTDSDLMAAAAFHIRGNKFNAREDSLVKIVRTELARRAA